tara:strand:- start:357 stop:1010 length:654 start_codon:yes stop_codon:yes gene_type:complete
MYVLNGTKVLTPGKTWTDDNGVQHPGNWASVWSEDVKASYGIKEVGIQEKPDGMFYSISGPALDGSWTSTPKNIDDVTEIIEGKEFITKGLKSQWIVKTKETANSLLTPTDWQVIAKVERDRAIDSDVATYRAAVIAKCTAIEKSITDITDTAIPSGYDAAKSKGEDDRTDAEKKIVSDYETEVATKFAAFKALFDVSVDSNGLPTGNAPIHDWPEE